MNDNVNPFGNLANDAASLEQAGDTLGGAGPFDSGVITGPIVLAYAGKTDSGANFLEVHVNAGAGRMYRERVYVTSGDAKGNKPYYEREGKKIPLPGFTVGNDIALLTTGFALDKQTFEEKVVKLYDFDAGAEVPTAVMAATSMMGKQISLGILRTTENKTKKNDNNQYVPTLDENGNPATRDVNSIDKVFHAESGRTVSEITAKQESADFQSKWLAKNDGVTRNKVKPVEGKSGAPNIGGGSSGGAAKGGSLFG